MRRTTPYRAISLVLLITLSSIAYAVAASVVLAALLGLPFAWSHLLFATLLPAIGVPVWAIPLVRANVRLRRMQEELQRLADTDPLTGLPNRRAFFVRAEDLFARCDLDGSPLAVMMIDIDHFKHVNDSYGHEAGDAVLRGVAAAIRTGIATIAPDGAAIVGRIGGEEFAAVVVGLPAPEAEALAERLCDDVRRCTTFAAGHAIVVTVSVGLARPNGSERFDGVLRSADRAVYAAKANGRDRWCREPDLVDASEATLQPELPLEVPRVRQRALAAE